MPLWGPWGGPCVICHCPFLFPLAGLYPWASAEGGQVEGAGAESWVELGNAVYATKVRLKNPPPRDIRFQASQSPGKAGRGGTGDTTLLLL